MFMTTNERIAPANMLNMSRGVIRTRKLTHCIVYFNQGCMITMYVYGKIKSYMTVLELIISTVCRVFVVYSE